MQFDDIKSVLTYVNVGLVAYITFLFKTLGFKINIDLSKFNPIIQLVILVSALLLFVLLELLMIFIFYKVVKI